MHYCRYSPLIVAFIRMNLAIESSNAVLNVCRFARRSQERGLESAPEPQHASLNNVDRTFLKYVIK